VTSLRCIPRVLNRFIVVLALLGIQTTSAISYTVQVVALSDQQAALELQRRLHQEGYPVYLVTFQTETGMVYRLRVGAFSNRAAALQFATAMQQLEGTTPAPALAEGIPAGLIPLEPELLAAYPYEPDYVTVDVLPWADTRVIRFQGLFEEAPFEAEYRVLNQELSRLPFKAWRAAPVAGAAGELYRVRNFPLWPANWDTLEEDALADHETSVLGTLAQSLDPDVESLRGFRFFLSGSGVPHLVVAERVSLATSEAQRLNAVGNPRRGYGEAGPALTWFNDREPEGFPADLPPALFDPISLLGRNPRRSVLPPVETLQLQGNGWRAAPDGRFTRLYMEESSRSWRAVAGYPLWVYEDFLLVFEAGELFLYSLNVR
jgi:hypothetical protein